MDIHHTTKIIKRRQHVGGDHSPPPQRQVPVCECERFSYYIIPPKLSIFPSIMSNKTTWTDYWMLTTTSQRSLGLAAAPPAAAPPFLLPPPPPVVGQEIHDKHIPYAKIARVCVRDESQAWRKKNSHTKKEKNMETINSVRGSAPSPFQPTQGETSPPPVSCMITPMCDKHDRRLGRHNGRMACHIILYVKQHTMKDKNRKYHFQERPFPSRDRIYIYSISTSPGQQKCQCIQKHRIFLTDVARRDQSFQRGSIKLFNSVGALFVLSVETSSFKNSVPEERRHFPKEVTSRM